MAKKLVDILPRKKRRILKEIKEKKEKQRTFQFPKFSPFLLFLIFLFLIFLWGYFFPTAKIQILPKVKERNFEDKIFAEINQKEINFKEKKIPAKIFEIEKEIEENFPATGKKLKKAEGKIRLYNNYTTQTETWRKGTRFMSSEGKLFLAKERFVVPGAKYVEGKLKPSFVDVEVIAAEGGKDYNIGPSKFSIVAFKGTERYFKYWGESFEPMKGGGEVFVVKKEDLENAISLLTEKLKKEKGREILEKEIPKEFVFPKEGFSVEILEKSFSKKEGEEAESFNLKLKVKLKTPILKLDDLKEYFEKVFHKNLEKETKILPPQKIEISSSISNFEKGKFMILAKEKLKTTTKIEPLFVKKEIAGKKISEAKFKLENLEGIEKAKIKIFPFWAQKIPENLEKIEISFLGID